jgi:hypothetical protein
MSDGTGKQRWSEAELTAGLRCGVSAVLPLSPEMLELRNEFERLTTQLLGWREEAFAAERRYVELLEDLAGTYGVTGEDDLVRDLFTSAVGYDRFMRTEVSPSDVRVPPTPDVDYP